MSCIYRVARKLSSKTFHIQVVKKYSFHSSEISPLYLESFNVQSGLSLRFQVAQQIQQVGGESNS